MGVVILRFEVWLVKRLGVLDAAAADLVLERLAELFAK